jgi:hypothetical protein
MAEKILERHCGETLTFTPKQTHVGTWLAKTRKSVALVAVFATIYDMGSLLDDATVYDQLLRRFPDSAKRKLGDSKEEHRNPAMLLAGVNRCFPDTTRSLQAEIQSSPGKFRQSPTTLFADHLEANSTKYRAHHPRKALTVDHYMTLFAHTHRLDTFNNPFAHSVFAMLKEHGAIPPTAADSDFTGVDIQHLIGCCHELDTLEAEQRSAHPSDESHHLMNKLLQRVTALEGKQQPRSHPARGAAYLQPNMAPASACAASRTQDSMDGGQNHRTKRRPNKFGRHTQSNVMAADPTDKVNVGAAIARAGSVLAASSHALQEGRSPSVGPSSFSIYDLVDNDNTLPDDICDDNEVCVEHLQANAVATRAQGSVHFAPIMRERPFDAAAPPAAVANRAADQQRPLKVKPKPSPPIHRTVHPKALHDPARPPASTDVTAGLQAHLLRLLIQCILPTPRAGLASSNAVGCEPTPGIYVVRPTLLTSPCAVNPRKQSFAGNTLPAESLIEWCKHCSARP